MSAFVPGSSFGDYRVVRKLGAGASGEVWLLVSGRSGLKTAAKILSEKEVRILADLLLDHLLVRKAGDPPSQPGAGL